MLKTFRLQFLAFLFLGIGYLAITLHQSELLQKRSIINKMGYLPNHQILKIMATDHRQSLASLLLLKALIYYGDQEEFGEDNLNPLTDFRGMYQYVRTTLKLDPYNSDAYFFAQAVLSWDTKQYMLSTELLEEGMHYRTWDFYLPFFAAFNYSHFLKDYKKSAFYYKRAAFLTGNESYSSMASRYFYESGQTEQAIEYLKSIIKVAKNDSIKNKLNLRLSAFIVVYNLEKNVCLFNERHKRIPKTISELVEKGLLEKEPQDPYGGKFIITSEGRVMSTSNFAVGFMNRKNKDKGIH